MTADYSFRDGYAGLLAIDGGEFRAPLDEFERLRAEWMAGASFLTFRQMSGADTTIKASRIEAITAWTADALEEHYRLTAEAKADAMLRGDG